MRLRFNRIGIIFALLITVGAISVSASNAHHCLIGEPITTWKTTDNWSKDYEEFALTSPANTKWDEFCIYMWVETNQTFAFNNHFFNPGEAKQVGPSSDLATINKDGGTGKGVATDGTTNAWKYTGATGLVKICAAQSSGDNGQGEWKPYVWVEESKEIEILKGNKIMFYFGMTTSWNKDWNVLRTSNTSEKTADQQYHRLPESKCSSWISVAYVSPAQYYVGQTGWAGVQMESTAEAGCLYSVYNDGSDKIYKNVADGAIPYFATTTVNKTVGTVDSEIVATANKSIYGNEQVLYYYYTTDGGTTFTKFDPSDISSLAVGVYTVYALGWDGHILVRSDNTVTLNVGVTISLDANEGTDGDVTSVFATSGVTASTGNIAVASLPTKTGYTFNGFWTLGGIEVINENGEWKTDVSGYTDNSGNWICSAASTLYAHWTPKSYTVTLEGMEADPDDPIMVNVTYDAVLPSLETKHTKAHYDLLGYRTSDDLGTTLDDKLIDANGNWIPNVTGYTGNDGEGHPTWIHDGIDISLFADWTEHPYTVTTSVSPAGAGTLSCGSSVTAKWVTPSELITATANPAWKFVRWEYGENVGPADGTGLDNTVQIKASVDGTLTAVFEPRFCLVGAKWDNSGNGGMPGWHDYDHTADFIVNSYTDLSNMNLTCVQSLDPNTTYTFMVYDKVKEKNIGYAASEQYIGNQSLLFNTEDQYAVALRVNGYGPCTFTISALSSGDLYPTVSVAIPASHQLNLEWADVDIDNNWNKTSRGTGGSVSAQTTESGHNFAILNEEYVAHGGDITYTATPATGYTFEGWYNDDYNTRFSTTNPYTSSNIQTTENVQAKFVEKATAVTLSNDGHGKVQIGGEDATSTTCGVTTTRQLNAVPNSGYSFSSWSITGSDISLSAPNTNPTTLTGRGSGASSQSVTANFSANNYTITLNDKHGGTTSASVTYDATSLTSISHASFEGWDLLGYWNTDGNKVIEANGDIVANVVNYTGSSGEWNYANNVTLYAHWSRSITLDNKEGSSGSVTVNYDESTTASLSAPSRTGYHVEGYYADNDRTHKVMEANGTLVNYTGYVESGKWVHATATTLYTKWAPNEYTVTLNNLEATTAGTESVTATYDATLSAITIPTKAHYDFGGYYISTDSGATLTNIQLIDASGNWNTGVSIYTSASKQWIYAGDITLYAKWTEHEYTIALSVSPSEAGTTSPSSSTIGKFVTASGDITASPAAGWKFKEWQFSKTDENYDAWCADGYSSTDATIHINAQHNGTLIAVFEPRYSLVGSLQDDSGNGGMPGWKDYTKTFTVNSSSPVDLTRTCPLQANKTYKLQVHDLATSTNLGRSGCDPVCVLEENASLVMENSDNDVFLYTSGAGEYIFKITAVDGSGHPTLTVLRPYQVNIGRKRVDIDGNDYDDNTGGTVDLSKQTAPETWTPISNGDWVPHGISVKYNASKEDGYTLDWYTASDYATQFSTEPYWFHTATSTGNGYAKFTEISTSVTLANDGHGHVEIGGATAPNTTVGVTTHRELTAVPNEGYKFSSWSKSGDDITLSSSSTNPTTLRGKGSGATSGQEVRANFVERWALSAQSEGWGSAEFNIANVSIVDGKAIGYVDIVLPANTDMQFKMVDKLTDDNYMNGSDQVYYMTNGNSHNWSFAIDKTYNCGITTAGAGTYRFIWNITDKKMTVTYPNFVIYRTGDKADDPRAQSTDVESYEGGTIEKAIEFRMRVNRLDYWYTLCLPFTVSAVKVWDEEDGQYYDIVPYYRKGDKYYTGHYILRRPVTTTNFAIEGFEGKDRWIDPESSNVLPSKNIPYIIQWHDSYFQNKYVSFLGAAGQIIPTIMDQGSYASSDETVNIYGNNSMTTGTVCDAYLLEPDYGPDGAWIREEIGTERSVLPFECFILANEKTTAKYRVLRRDMADDTPTGLDTLSMTEDSVSKVMINNRIYIIRGGKMYTIQGTFVKEVE